MNSKVSIEVVNKCQIVSNSELSDLSALSDNCAEEPTVCPVVPPHGVKWHSSLPPPPPKRTNHSLASWKRSLPLQPSLALLNEISANILPHDLPLHNLARATPRKFRKSLPQTPLYVINEEDEVNSNQAVKKRKKKSKSKKHEIIYPARDIVPEQGIYSNKDFEEECTSFIADYQVSSKAVEIADSNPNKVVTSLLPHIVITLDDQEKVDNLSTEFSVENTENQGEDDSWHEISEELFNELFIGTHTRASDFTNEKFNNGNKDITMSTVVVPTLSHVDTLNDIEENNTPDCAKDAEDSSLISNKCKEGIASAEVIEVGLLGGVQDEQVSLTVRAKVNEVGPLATAEGVDEHVTNVATTLPAPPFEGPPELEVSQDLFTEVAVSSSQVSEQIESNVSNLSGTIYLPSAPGASLDNDVAEGRVKRVKDYCDLALNGGCLASIEKIQLANRHHQEDVTDTEHVSFTGLTINTSNQDKDIEPTNSSFEENNAKNSADATVYETINLSCLEAADEHATDTDASDAGSTASLENANIMLNEKPIHYSNESTATAADDGQLQFASNNKYCK